MSGLPSKVYLIVRSTGERHFLDRLDDIESWAEGLDVTVAEYELKRIVHTPPPTEKESQP